MGRIFRGNQEITPVQIIGSDLSDTTATANDVLSPKVFYNSIGSRTVGTLQTYSEATAITSNSVINTRNKYLATNLNVDVNVDIEAGVKFIDYDGTILYLWKSEEIASKLTLPNNPPNTTTLVAAGWNWTLDEIKDYFADNPTALLTVGQTYTPNNIHETSLYITIDSDIKKVGLSIYSESNFNVDWGDGTATQVSGTSSAPIRSVYMHSYVNSGDYIIKICSGATSYMQWYNSGRLLSSYSDENVRLSHNTILKKVELGVSLRPIFSSSAFESCVNLETITIAPNTNVFANNLLIPSYLFRQCYSLKCVIIPRHTFKPITQIQAGAFMNCWSIKEISLPKSITAIYTSAFNGCKNLHNLFIPPTLTSIAQFSFSGCSTLSKIILPNNLVSIGANAFSSTAITFSYSSTSLTTIDPYVFSYSQISKIDISQCPLTTFGTGLFSSCYRLTEILLPNTLTALPSNLCADCNSLYKITIPSSVTSIGSGVFYRCYNLMEVHFLSSEPPIASGQFFDQVPVQCKIYIPTGSLAAYTSATNYPSSSTYTYIEE